MKKFIAAITMLAVLLTCSMGFARDLERVAIGVSVARSAQLAELKAEGKAMDKAEKRCDKRGGDVIVHSVHTFSNRDGRLHAAESNLIYNCTTD